MNFTSIVNNHAPTRLYHVYLLLPTLRLDRLINEGEIVDTGYNRALARHLLFHTVNVVHDTSAATRTCV